MPLRYLLEERNQTYTKFVELLFGDMDIAAHEIQFSNTIEDLISKAGGTLEIVSDTFDNNSLWNTEPTKRTLRHASNIISGSLTITSDKHVNMSEPMLASLNAKQSTLFARLK